MELVTPVANKIIFKPYGCRFAKKQEDYDAAVRELFDAYQKVNDLLGKQRYLTGNKLTNLDLRLFTAALRQDLVYNPLFGANKLLVSTLPNVQGFLREICQVCALLVSACACAPTTQ